ncbi:hypothetical protein [uncultured Dialister sp.]|uniref:hypothetical protein n=1 Tax=uncultured Dialister sp. TaxID=278064 RepID=UPI00206A6CF0|nr:hypothetical protein [uncultured Dialister sp.]DAE67648.1 MAG TPA: hypothetical protein [Caudoviricetes sp.]
MFEKDQDMSNAADFGFTEEDLKGFVPEDQDKKQDEPAPAPADSQPEPQPTPEPAVDAPKPQDEPPAPAPADDQNVDKPQDGADGHGDLGKALAEERARRKAMGDEVNQLKAQLEQMRQAQNQQGQMPAVPPQTRQQIIEYAKKEAARRMNLQNVDDLMFTDPAKYDEFLRMQGAIAYNQEAQVQKAMTVRVQNVAFAQEIMATPNIQAIYQKGNEMLNDMKRMDARVIDDAFNRVDQGVGTEKDFKIIRDFRDKVVAAMQQGTGAPAPAQAGNGAPAPAPAPESNPLTQAAGLPKAAALTGANPAQPKLTNEDILRAVREGREKDLPKDIQRAIDEYCG